MANETRLVTPTPEGETRIVQAFGSWAAFEAELKQWVIDRVTQYESLAITADIDNRVAAAHANAKADLADMTITTATS